MSEGCNLLISEHDLEQIEESARKGQASEINEFVQRDLLGKEPGWQNRLTDALSKTEHPAHKLAVAVALKNILGNEFFEKVEKEKLAQSLTTITKITPNILGLVHPAKNYGPGATAVLGNLKHKTRGYAFAYEINATAALINRPSTAGNAKVTLHISPSDRVDMGIKLQASYPGVDRKSTGLYRPRRGTVEADTFVDSKARGALGIDFKFSKTGEGSTVDESQLKGVFNAIRTGEVNEFHFVANGTFGKNVKERIDYYNEKLEELEMKSRTDFTKEEVEATFTKVEKALFSSKSGPKMFWHENVK